ncbi:FkbM family methyltransferase [uncultured Acetatifactor sp.]|uniref:FkbM family methyltransferase n=1 Tax=uncultured Acetatifactor sp. TaxID=1671927 RepID=UPI00262140B0|nr:FkbM family methyltransferase [uncultured Acetatifactor sp.]
MKIATLLFTYNRSRHTGQVIESLKNNTVLPEKLIVFQDGVRQDEDAEEWQKVNRLIHDIDWCEKEVIVSEYNKGLAESIVSGVDYAFKENDAVIVLEDDCVAAPNFIRFMEQCFERYETEKSVFSVSGYSWPIELGDAESDIYFCGRTSSWGWGTWRDRWRQYEKDYSLYKRLKMDRESSERLATWGNDIEQTVIGNVTGVTDSWGLFWVMKAIEKNALCINPYKSLIRNIGMDGSGVHCGITDGYDVEQDNFVKDSYELADKIELTAEVKEAFAGLFGSYTAVNSYSEDKEKIIVYGLGNFFISNEKSINENYFIECFIDNLKTGYYAGKKIFKAKEIGRIGDISKILIMIQDINECMKVCKELVGKYGIAIEKIELGCQYYGIYQNVIKNVFVKGDGRWEITLGGITLCIASADQFYNAYEVLVGKIYRYYISNTRKDIVFDVGMNIGDATLFFLENKNVEKVYGYEPFRETFQLAVENLGKCGEKGRYEICQYGLSKQEEKRKIIFNEGMTCGQSTNMDMWEQAYAYYDALGLAHADNNRLEEIEVKMASQVLGNAMNQYPNHNYILKMDCEGEEYSIIEELNAAGILGRFKVIMLEWHYKGFKKITDFIDGLGYSYFFFEKENGMGLIYAQKVAG